MRRFTLVALVPLLARLWDGGMSLNTHLPRISGKQRAVGVGSAGNAPTGSSSSSSWEAAKVEASRLASDPCQTPTLRYVPWEGAKAQASLVARDNSLELMPLLPEMDKALIRGAPGRVEELITPVPGHG